MPDHHLSIPGFKHDAGQVQRWTGYQASTGPGGRVTIHPCLADGTESEPTPQGLERFRTHLTSVRPFHISVEPPCIPADGETPAVVHVQSNAVRVTLLVRSLPVEVEFGPDGNGSLHITADAPTKPPHIVVEAQDKDTFGHRAVVIQAVEP